MSKISTDDCKNFLKESFPEQKNWKRIKKYKNDAGQWCRDFESESGFATTLVEIDERLTLISQEQKEIDCFYYKKFPDDEIKLAKKIVSNYVRDYYHRNVNYKMAGYEAIPNCFEFFVDTENDEYTPESIIDDKTYQNCDIGLFFVPINHQFDQHLQDILKDFLPESMSEMAECIFEIVPDKPIAIKDLIQSVCDRGFIYNSEYCGLAKYLKKHKVLPKP